VTPTVGRIVHLHRFGAPPCAAIITGVVDAVTVNVVAFEITGLTFALDVPFGFPPDAGAVDGRPFWIWPPRNEGREL